MSRRWRNSPRWSQQLRRDYGITYFSLGGGIGAVYRDALASGAAAWWESLPPDKRPITPEAYGAALQPLLKPLGLKLLLEPGRFMVANAGVLLARVEYLKRGHGKNFLILDAAMNDLVRPAMYDAYHEIVPLQRDTSRRALKADIVGPICESSDCFAKDRDLQELGEGEYVAFMTAGAYGYAMAEPLQLPADAGRGACPRRQLRAGHVRESFEQMIAGERVPAWLK